MDPSAKMPPQTSLFQVYLRLRPPIQNALPKLQDSDPWLIVEPPSPCAVEQVKDAVVPSTPTHITLQPPNDSRKRAIERFGFTKVFQEEATQLDIFEETGTVQLVRNVLNEGRDGLVATLGVTGSGKSHTILGSRTQRGLTQMTLDVLFKSIGSQICRPDHPDLPTDTELLRSLQVSDASEAQISSANAFLESVYGDMDRGRNSRAQTPMVGRSSRAQTPMMESLPRKPHLAARPSQLPRVPDVSSYVSEVDSASEYVVLVSMYEVYNDRIFDLLSSLQQQNAEKTSNTRAGAALSKDLRRRPLLFKSTEMSQDRKLVAGLRKVVCGSYDEAMMVLETGLTERRVAGTGSNSVSSRSHGFFCVEVKQNIRAAGSHEDVWTGGTLSIVDLAGSERARNAKTTGSTLAEAGKINESLMYLGQCLQVQSDCQHDGSKPIVPFRQCKLTELLFSNSFPSTNAHHQASYRTPQKAIMIVTADPQGDFNATSQILRYSALAREVTVPRIPSVTSTILQGGVRGGAANGRLSPHDHHITHEELEAAALEIARISMECDQLAMRVAEEEIRRQEAELRVSAAEEKTLLVEQEVREECWQEMEDHIDEERQRWRRAWDEEKGRGEVYLDGKISIIEKGVGVDVEIHEDAGARTDDLERENQTLRAKVEALERELQQRSPTKKSKTTNTSLYRETPVLQENANPIPSNHFLASLRGDGDDHTILGKMRSFELETSPRKASLRSSGAVKVETELSPRKVSVPKTPATGRKIRKLTSRKMDLGAESDLE